MKTVWRGLCLSQALSVAGHGDDDVRDCWHSHVLVPPYVTKQVVDEVVLEHHPEDA